MSDLVNKTPIRILNVFSSLARGGSLSMCMNYYRHIDRDRVQFDFVVHADAEGGFDEEIALLGGRVYRAPKYRVWNHAQYIEWWKKHLITHPEHVLVHGHYYTVTFLYAPTAKRLGRTVIAHSHNVRNGLVEGPLKKLALSVARCKTEGRADVRLACSSAAGEWLFPHESFCIINNAVEPERFAYNEVIREEVRSELDVEPDCKLIAVVGSITNQKNPQGVLSICKELVQRQTQWRLVWCGDGPLRMAMEVEAKQAGLAQNIVFTGMRPDVARILQGADTFLMPSFFEGLSVAAIEAQAAGLPCFLSDNLDRAHDVTGLCRFLPLNNWDIWADAILVDNPDRKVTSALIREAGYDVRFEANKLQQLYLDLAKGNKISY